MLRPVVKFGNLLEMHVCDNVGDHLVRPFLLWRFVLTLVQIGNVYARYEWEDDAQSAVDNLNDRWYGGMPYPSSVLA
jgi:splicing factor U2AF subunit